MSISASEFNGGGSGNGEAKPEAEAKTAGKPVTHDEVTDMVRSSVISPEAEGASNDDALGDAGKKALHAEREARKEAEKRLKELDARVKEFEDRDKTEQERAQEHLERLTGDLDATRASLAAAELNLARVEVAHAKGIPAELVPRLRGETREELEADADELLGIVGKREAEAPRKPKPVGSLGTGGDARLTPQEQFAAIMQQAL